MIETTRAAEFVDGRQSEAETRIRRGARRLLRQLDYATLCELPLRNGRRADIVGLGDGARLLIVEVKSSVADFRADGKWRDYRDHCDELLFAVDADFPARILPEDAGLIVADRYGGHLERRGREHKLAPATRREMLSRFARVAADRLHMLEDSDARRPGE
jgi:hypothetical protein